MWASLDCFTTSMFLFNSGGHDGGRKKKGILIFLNKKNNTRKKQKKQTKKNQKLWSYGKGTGFLSRKLVVHFLKLAFSPPLSFFVCCLFICHQTPPRFWPDRPHIFWS